MSLGTATEKLAEALWSRLSDDATLLTLTGAHPDNGAKARVYDEPPDNPTMPYVVLDMATSEPFNTFGKTGREFLVDVHCYSEARGSQEVQQILARVEVLLNDQHAAFTVTGHTLARIALDDMNLLREPPRLRHGIARYRVTVQEA